MENPTPPQMKPAEVSTSEPQPNFTQAADKRNVWKIFAIILGSIIVPLSLLAWYGFHLQKEGQAMTGKGVNEFQDGKIINKNMTQTNVLIDSSNEAYTVFLMYPPGTSEQQLEGFKAQYSADGLKASILPFSEFTAMSLKSKLIKNEYPEVDTEKGILLLLQKYPGTPIGLTWTGGIAFTNHDYRYAEKTFEKYKTSPNDYVTIRPKDRAADPIHPLNQFESLLGVEWSK